MPKAYLNILFFDEQFRFVGSGSEIIQVTTKGSGQTMTRISGSAKEAMKNGYTYVFVSNESNNLVYFDNLQVTHERGPIIEESHYYPFGLTMAGISSRAMSFGNPENKKRFGGKELQHKEFSDGSGLELYDFGARNQDPQIGRWWSIDPLATKRDRLTPYNYVQNNPLIRIDPKGETDFKLTEKTGEINQVGDKNDKPDRILQTNSKGEVKLKGEGFLGFLVRKSERGKAKVAIDNIEKGILKDGINFKNKDNVIDVGGTNQPSQKGVEGFVMKFSNYIDKEISGYFLTGKNETNVSHVYISQYKDNLPDRAVNHYDLYNVRHDLYNNFNATTYFHTHLSRFSDRERLEASPRDKMTKENELTNGIKNFIIITTPQNIEY